MTFRQPELPLGGEVGDELAGAVGDGPGGGYRIARGARHAEAIVLAAVRAHVAAVREDPCRLARPLRVVVPSRALREHLAASLVRDLGHAAAGVVVQTLNGVAHEILRRAGEELRTGEALLPALVRQQARERAPLREALDGLEDGYRASLGSVSDLLDAGFEPAQAEACAECLAEAEPHEVARASALCEVAVGTLGALEKLGLVHRAALHRRAAELLGSSDAALPAHGVWIHGFADATGSATELLRALVLHARAELVLDHPPDPTDPAATDAGERFTRRLAGVLTGLASRREVEAPAPEPARLRRGAAPGAGAEARAVAERIRGLLDAGVEPERIGVVVRQLDPYLTPLRVQLSRMGVPFSGAPGSVGPLSPAGRRLRALFELVAQGESAPVDRWLDAWRGASPGRRALLRVAFHTLGAGRLRDAAELRLDERLGAEDSLPLPFRKGFTAGEEDEQAVRVPRKHVERADLEEAVASLRALLAGLRQATEASTLGEHLRHLDRLRGELLGWRGDPASEAFETALGALRSELAAGWPIAHGDFLLLLERSLAHAGRLAPGGEGGGVRLLSVTDARAFTFEHLFLLGMNRDLFPRVVSEDPLLPDASRRRLETVLADIPVKARGFDEERYLFAQLLSSSPEVWLSWQEVSDDGKERTPSPFVERLRLAEVGEPVALAPSLVGEVAGARRHTALEHAVRGGLLGREPETLLGLALADAREAHPGNAGRSDLAAVARARAAVVRELDRAGGRDPVLGPFFGAVGPVGPRDPRSGDSPITLLEGIARCPWQAFLRRVLKLEAAPDARAALPDLSPQLVGNLVHALLERIAVEAGAASKVPVERALAAAPRDVPWPDAGRLRRWLVEEAHGVVEEAGILLPGFAFALAERVKENLERARAADFAPCARGVLACEVEGQVEIPGPPRPRRIRFRADRLDRIDGRLRFTDYKTGARDRLLRDVRRGHALQAAAYAASASAAEGRYLTANPRVEPEQAELAFAEGDEAVREAFQASARVLLACWEQGWLPPRLLDASGAKEPESCQWCEVSDACLRGDSGARARLRRWLDASGGEPEGQASARALWSLPGVDP